MPEMQARVAFPRGFSSLAVGVEIEHFRAMISTLDAFTADGRVVISFPESAVPAREREDFIAFLKIPNNKNGRSY